MQKRMIIEFGPDAEIINDLNVVVISVPIQEIGPVFEGKNLMEATKGISPAVVESLCEDFIMQIQKQQFLSTLHIHTAISETKKSMPKTVRDQEIGRPRG